MTQTARPISDVSNTGNWAVAPLWSKTNDSSDSTYITGTDTNKLCVLKLATLGDPLVHTGHVIYVRARVAAGSGAGENLQFQLLQGSTVVGSSAPVISRTTITTYSYALGTSEPDLITDYSDLRIGLTTAYLQEGEAINVYDVWMECPGIDAAPITTSTVAVSAAVPAPTITITPTATPSAVATTVAIPIPTLTGDASLEPTTVAAYIGVGSPDIPIPESPTVYPDTVALGLGIGDNWSAVATATTGGPGDVSPGLADVTIAVPEPTLSADANVTPDAVATTVAVPAPTLTGDASLIAVTVAVLAAVPAPTTSAIDPDAVVTPSTVAVGVAVPTPTITAVVMISVTVIPDTIAVAAVVPTAAAVTHHKRRHRGPIVSALERKYKM